MPASLRLAALRDDLASRLRPVCADWPDELFATLIEHVATTTLKYEGRGSATTYDVRTTDALVNKLEAGLRRSEEIRNRPPSLARGMGAIPHASNRTGVPGRVLPERPGSGGA